MASDYVSKLRRDYTRQTLDLGDLNPDPFTQFQVWFTDAKDSGEVLEPNAMSLGTVNAAGQPSLRTVLLKALDAEGFTFFTNYGSDKAMEIQANPKVSLLFFWPALERQIKIQGEADRVSREESVAYFHSRPVGSQLGAWVSEQSHEIASREVLTTKLEELKTQFGDGEIPCPEFWGGFRVIPSRFEFWQGGPDRLHDCFRYSLQEGLWKIQRVAP